MNQGISTLQGPHHVAQKLRSTTLPLYSESFTVAPVASFRAKSGVGLRSFADFKWKLSGIGASQEARIATAAAKSAQRRIERTVSFCPRMVLLYDPITLRRACRPAGAPQTSAGESGVARRQACIRRAREARRTARPRYRRSFRKRSGARLESAPEC